jgi:hypothetical protein
MPLISLSFLDVYDSHTHTHTHTYTHTHTHRERGEGGKERDKDGEREKKHALPSLFTNNTNSTKKKFYKTGHSDDSSDPKLRIQNKKNRIEVLLPMISKLVTIAR